MAQCQRRARRWWTVWRTRWHPSPRLLSKVTNNFKILMKCFLCAGGAAMFTWTTQRNGLWAPTEARTCFRWKKTLKTKIRDRFMLIKTTFKHESNLRPWYTSSATLLVFPTRTNDQPSWLLFTRCCLSANRIIAPPYKASSPKNVCVLVHLCSRSNWSFALFGAHH